MQIDQSQTRIDINEEHQRNDQTEQQQQMNNQPAIIQESAAAVAEQKVSNYQTKQQEFQDNTNQAYHNNQGLPDYHNNQQEFQSPNQGFQANINMCPSSTSNSDCGSAGTCTNTDQDCSIGGGRQNTGGGTFGRGPDRRPNGWAKFAAGDVPEPPPPPRTATIKREKKVKIYDEAVHRL